MVIRGERKEGRCCHHVLDRKTGGHVGLFEWGAPNFPRPCVRGRDNPRSGEGEREVPTAQTAGFPYVFRVCGCDFVGLERGHRDLLVVSSVEGGIENGVRRAAEFLAMVEKDKAEAR